MSIIFEGKIMPLKVRLNKPCPKCGRSELDWLVGEVNGPDGGLLIQCDSCKTYFKATRKLTELK